MEALIDGHRVYPVKYLVIHHTAGDDKKNLSNLEIMDYFDVTGRNRGYESVRKKRGYKTIRSYHTHPLRDKETFAQAQFSLHRYNIDGNPYGWEIVPLMLAPYKNVAWHAGNWKINQQSIGIEICGTYTDKKIDEKALQCIADYFRSYYQELKSKGIELIVSGHKDYARTICPGMIYDQLPLLRKLLATN